MNNSRRWNSGHVAQQIAVGIILVLFGLAGLAGYVLYKAVASAW